MSALYTSGSDSEGVSQYAVILLLRFDPNKPKWIERDRFILSKAHGSAALYAILAEVGYFSKEILDKYYVDGGILPGHLDRAAVPGVETSGGSLGHGLSLGIGMVLGNQLDAINANVYVLIGDGECNEGSIWEAAMLAGHLQLRNLVVLIDKNQIQSFGNTVDIIDQSNMADRWRAFGWNAEIVSNGHDHDLLYQVLTSRVVGSASNRPRAIVLNTVKGKGVSFMENQLAWHYKSPNDAELALALNELDDK